MSNDPIIKDNKTAKQILWGMAAYSSASILGPLVFFGGIGMILDRVLDKSPLFLLIGIGIAFVSTNILLFAKLRKVTKMFDTIEENEKKDELVNEVSKEKQD